MHSVLFSFLLLSWMSQSSPDLDTVLHRASDYVTRYEAELGNLIGTEEYVQNVAYKGVGARYGMITKREQRRMSSDFLIIQVGKEWSALRKANRVDGSAVKETESFETAFDDSPASNRKRLDQMKLDSTRYNIGGILREINLPTFALAVLRKSEVDRFSFEKAGIDKIDGTPAWAVRFREMKGWTLVHGQPDEELFSHGTFWIEPDTGRILKTEFMVENQFAKPEIRGRIVVNYGMSKKLDMLVPSLMVEHYENDYNTIDCRADYQNFRQFEVDVKFDLGPTKP
jgi:hypothetical protein